MLSDRAHEGVRSAHTRSAEVAADERLDVRDRMLHRKRIEEIEKPTMREIRYLDKLVDELAKGKTMEKILRK